MGTCRRVCEGQVLMLGVFLGDSPPYMLSYSLSFEARVYQFGYSWLTGLLLGPLSLLSNSVVTGRPPCLPRCWETELEFSHFPGKHFIPSANFLNIFQK